MRRIGCWILAVAMLLTLAACAGQQMPENVEEPETIDGSETTKEPEKTETPEGTEEEEFSSEKVEPQIALNVAVHRANQTDEDGTLLLQEELAEPSIHMEDAAAGDAINQVLSTYWQQRRAMADGTLALARQMKEQAEEQEMSFSGYAVTDSVHAGRLDGSVVSLYILAADNLGGAHGTLSGTTLNFDAATGAQLELEDLTDDVESLRALVAETASEEIQKNPDHYFPNAANETANLLGETGWYLADDGLTVLCDPYSLAPFAAGMLEFMVPYGELDGILRDQWMPPERAAVSGTVQAALTADAPDVEPWNTVAVDETGAEFTLWAEGDVEQFRLMQVSSADGETWYAGDIYFAADHLSDGQGVAVCAMLPDVMTSVMAVWESDGETVCCGVMESGKDGSIFLMPLEQVVW